ncbi:MAG: capsular polysaccharide biosynthesis protein [Rhizobiales bacterium]|nr:capsular polysaccharide biosynthesis protein [Hyphomicrobiales bacterium]
MEQLTGQRPFLAKPSIIARNVSAIAGWGHKHTAASAIALAEARKLPYVAFEDGFLRSVRPGPQEAPQSIIMDTVGIYYDAREPSALEEMLAGDHQLDAAGRDRATRAIAVLRENRLSKYNDAPPFPDTGPPPKDRKQRVLVIDQTRGDASIEGGLADASSFEAMFHASLTENPGAEIIVKLHPEVVSGKKAGYLADLARQQPVTILAEPVNPWLMLEQVGKVYTVSSQLGFEALLAGCTVVCFGAPFYAGWGLTDDRQAIPRRNRKRSLLDVMDAAYLRYCHYFCAWTGRPIDFFTAAAQLIFRRDHYHRQSVPVICYGITLWKRPAVRAMLSGRAGDPQFVSSLNGAIATAKTEGAAIATWGSTARKIRACTSAAGVDLTTIEDGFLRSVGLGANFVPARSLVFDRTGIYFDPSAPSDLETLLQETDFDDAVLARAAALRERIVAAQLTKYNVDGSAVLPDLPADREIILVPGQVADDESIRLGAARLFAAEALSAGGANLALLKAVRERNRDATIIYKPHPDVEAGLRAGRIEHGIAAGLADIVFTQGSLLSLFPVISRVETATSLTGFEALLRGLEVVTHGQPFYAGWGLTDDLDPVTRRTRKLDLDQLVAATMLLYPVYYDPHTRSACPADTVLEDFIQAKGRQTPGLTRAANSLKKLFARSRYQVVKTFRRNR